jgi:hypothetical protein
MHLNLQKYISGTKKSQFNTQSAKYAIWLQYSLLICRIAINLRLYASSRTCSRLLVHLVVNLSLSYAFASLMLQGNI